MAHLILGSHEHFFYLSSCNARMKVGHDNTMAIVFIIVSMMNRHHVIQFVIRPTSRLHISGTYRISFHEELPRSSSPYRELLHWLLMIDLIMNFWRVIRLQLPTIQEHKITNHLWHYILYYTSTRPKDGTNNQNCDCRWWHCWQFNCLFLGKTPNTINIQLMTLEWLLCQWHGGQILV